MSFKYDNKVTVRDFWRLRRIARAPDDIFFRGDDFINAVYIVSSNESNMCIEFFLNENEVDDPDYLSHIIFIAARPFMKVRNVSKEHLAYRKIVRTPLEVQSLHENIHVVDPPVRLNEDSKSFQLLKRMYGTEEKYFLEHNQFNLRQALGLVEEDTEGLLAAKSEGQ